MANLSSTQVPLRLAVVGHDASAVVAGAGGKSARLDLLDTVRRYAEAWQANDISAVLASYHDDFVLHYFGERAATLVVHGRDIASTC